MGASDVVGVVLDAVRDIRVLNTSEVDQRISGHTSEAGVCVWLVDVAVID